MSHRRVERWRPYRRDCGFTHGGVEEIDANYCPYRLAPPPPEDEGQAAVGEKLGLMMSSRQMYVLLHFPPAGGTSTFRLEPYKDGVLIE